MLGIEATWSKNAGKNWSCAREMNVLEFTDDPSRVTGCPSGANVESHKIQLTSTVVGWIGYDGLTPEIGTNGNCCT